MIIPITAVFAGVTGLLLLFLSYRVSTFRLKHKQGIGVNDDRDFEIAVRSQGNLTEYAPIALILMAIGELNGVATMAVYVVGMAFVAGRFLHPWGMVKGRGKTHPARLAGILLTWLSILAMSVLVLVNAL